MDLPADLARETLDALTLNLAVLDSDGVIVASNRAWQQFGQFNDIEGPVDTVGENYLHVTEAADDEYATRAARGLRAVLDGERDAFQLEYPCHSPDEKRWFLMHASRFTADGDSYVVVAHENITIRKQAEQEVQRRNDDLEAFARLLSHDLRNPLSVAQGHADLLAEETTPNTSSGSGRRWTGWTPSSRTRWRSCATKRTPSTERRSRSGRSPTGRGTTWTPGTRR